MIFTTAYDQHALEAFQTNSVDYLLKPIEPQRPDRALQKAERMLGQVSQPLDVPALIAQITAALRPSATGAWLSRVASRSGDRVDVVDLRHVTHFFARDKLTFAATAERAFVVDQTIAELGERLNPSRFVRSPGCDRESRSPAGSAWRVRRPDVRLKDAKRTSLTVARDRVRPLRARLSLVGGRP